MSETGHPMATAGVTPGLAVRVGDQRITIRAGEPALIGRDPTCRVVLPVPQVSRRHAELAYTPAGWELRDLGSTNGMFVDGQRVQVLRIGAGARVRFGGADDTGLVMLLGREAVASSASQPGSLSGLSQPSVPAFGAAPPLSGQHRAPAAPEPVRQFVASQHPATGRVAMAQHTATGRIRIGRDGSNDIVLNDLGVSRGHAEVRPTGGGGFEVIDLGSANGTFHNGRQVLRAPLREGDHISIGRHRFVFENQRLQQFVDTGPVSLVADSLAVQIGGNTLIHDVSFALPEASLLAVVGPSGCGKSTLLRAMTGLRPATSGRVRYDGRDLYQNYSELRYRIGLVPQDDVLHKQLTVQRALRFSAALRFATDVPQQQRWERVDQVINLLSLANRAHQRIDTLSGGQRKRTSVALELLTEPSLLYLDEPTSGLDPALDKGLMNELREIADSGRTVVVVTHSVLHLDTCDRVLAMCPGGTIGYFGPPDKILEYFGAKDYAEVFTSITNDPERWTQHYRNSDMYRRYVLDIMAREPARMMLPPTMPPGAIPPVGAPPAMVPGAGPMPGGRAGFPGAGPGPGPLPPMPPPAVSGPRHAPAPAPRPAAAGPPARGGPGGIGQPVLLRALHPTQPARQFGTLCSRMLAVIAADRGYSLFLVAMPLALALISRTVPGSDGLSFPKQPFSAEAQRLLVVLAVGAAFLGIATAIREIVNESTIYSRERAVGLSPGAYLGSKLAVFLLLDVVQVVVFVYLSLLGRGKPAMSLVISPPLLEIMIPLILVALASTAFGLLVSAVVKTSEQTTPVLVVSVMAQLVLSGGLFELNGSAGLAQISWLVPTRWGFAANAGTVRLTTILRTHEPLWAHTAGSWWRAVLVLIVLAVAAAVAARVALRRHEPGRGR